MTKMMMMMIKPHLDYWRFELRGMMTKTKPSLAGFLRGVGFFCFLILLGILNFVEILCHTIILFSGVYYHFIGFIAQVLAIVLGGCNLVRAFKGKEIHEAHEPNIDSIEKPMGENSIEEAKREEGAVENENEESLEEVKLDNEVRRKKDAYNKASTRGVGEFLADMKHLEHFGVLLQQLNSLVIGAVDKDVEEKADIIVEDDCKVDSFSSTFCSICRDDEDTLDNQMIKLSSCQHYAHVACLRQQLQSRWPGKSISFTYLQCAECRSALRHDTLHHHLTPHLHLKEKVEQLCLQQARADNLIEDFEKKMVEEKEETTARCMSTLSCYLCAQCSEPFCGGRVDCAEDDQLDTSALCCPSCAFAKTEDDVLTPSSSKTTSVWRGKCTTHGYKFAIYKCDSCCSVATWDCRSNHYCERCHNQAYVNKDYKCPGVDQCPLGIPHPPNSSAVHGQVENGFVIGCSKCFLGPEDSSDFELVEESSAREYLENWKDRF
jgi:hypothetical protein